VRPVTKLRPIDELVDSLLKRGRHDYSVRSLIEQAKNRRIPGVVKVGGRWVWNEADENAIMAALPNRGRIR
jgi:hypothetical protein